MLCRRLRESTNSSSKKSAASYTGSLIRKIEVNMRPFIDRTQTITGSEELGDIQTSSATSKTIVPRSANV